MYGYTMVVAGLRGVALIVAPDQAVAAFGWPEQDPIVLGVMASVYAAFGLLAALGLSRPLKFVPILCLQLVYKSLWLLFVAVPLLVTGALPAHGPLFIAIFVSYVIGDLIAIPFRYVLSGPQAQVPSNE